MKVIAIAAAGFFLTAAVGNLARKDMIGALECIGLISLSLYLASPSPTKSGSAE